MRIPALILTAILALTACGGDDDGTEADRRGVGAQCAEDADCTEEGQRCLLQFKGGYCGIEGCAADADCPSGSACVAHEDKSTYCFRICNDKAECNRNRSEANEANCSASVDFVDDRDGKACIPPTGS